MEVFLYSNSETIESSRRSSSSTSCASLGSMPDRLTRSISTSISEGVAWARSSGLGLAANPAEGSQMGQAHRTHSTGIHACLPQAYDSKPCDLNSFPGADQFDDAPHSLPEQSLLRSTMATAIQQPLKIGVRNQLRQEIDPL